MLDLEPIKARLAAATPGPWSVAGPGNLTSATICDLGLGDYEIAIPDGAESRPRANAALIAHAPGDLATLVDENERLRAALTKIIRGADCGLEFNEGQADGWYAGVAWAKSIAQGSMGADA